MLWDVCVFADKQVYIKLPGFTMEFDVNFSAIQTGKEWHILNLGLGKHNNDKNVQ